MTVHYERIPSRDPRLNRHIRHDDRSRNYPYSTDGLTIVSAKHTRRIPVLDQGQLGSCTGNAGIGCLGTDPYYDTWSADMPFPLNEPGAVKLYGEATKVDDYPGGYYAPSWQATGSDGLSIAKVLKANAAISGYQHTFSRDDALKALGVTPAIVGIPWTNDMFNPDADGRVHPTGSIAGGHEICADEIDAERQRVWFTNSWGTGWGLAGRFYLSFTDFGDLLSQQGDVTIFTPLTSPAPTPTPVPTPGDADRALAAALRHNNWIHEHHIGDNHKVAVAGAAWLTAHPDL